MERNHLNAIISRNLLLVRQQRRLSQTEVAAVLRIKQPSYNRMESGKTHISADQLAMLAEFYDLFVAAFFNESRKYERYA